jgi:very-short-patch-repair endonuclease
MERESARSRAVPDLPRTRGDDRPLAQLAGRQHGVVARSQLLEAGWTKDEIVWRLHVGRLHRIHEGIYSTGSRRLLTRQGNWMAAVLAGGPATVLSHWSAAALWKIRSNGRNRIDVTVAHRSRSSKGIYRHVSLVPPDERAVEEGISVTSVHRTIFDLAAHEEVDVVVAMIREAEYLNRWDRLSLPHLLERYPGKRGSRKVRFALERLKEEPPGRKRSRLEERFAPFLRRHQLALPRFNDWLFINGKRYQVDCHWPGTHQIVELDGWQGHHTRSAFREDRARDRALHVAGYSVIHLTWSQLDDEAEQIASDLRALLQYKRL